MTILVGTLMPTFDGATEWLNDVVSVAGLRGNPTVVRFWAVSCPVCKANAPDVNRLIQQYSLHGVRLVSIHMPRKPSDMDTDAVRIAASELQMTEPCAIDNSHAIGKRFQTSGLWPYYFLFDTEGKMRRHAAGPSGLRLIELSLKRLLDRENTLDEQRESRGNSPVVLGSGI